jgi:uncharacterized membrane protein
MRYVSLAMIVVAVALSFILYPALPELMPTHWNLQGQVNGWSEKMLGAFLMPLVMLAVLALFAVLPRISPRGYAMDGRSRAYRAIEMSIVAFSLSVHIMILLAATGTPVNVSILIPLLAGALFVILGNYMTKMRRNFFIGIRTPWTLANEDVWFRTHRLGAKVFVAAGLALMIVPFTGNAQKVAFPAIALAAALVPAVYSYVIYRRLEKGAVE